MSVLQFSSFKSRKQLAMIKRRKRVSGDKLPKGRKRGASLKKSTNNEMAPVDGIQADPSQFVAFHHESITYTEVINVSNEMQDSYQITQFVRRTQCHRAF